MPKRTLFVNGPIHTFEESPRAEALLVEGDRIAAVGSARNLEARAAGVHRVDLAGAALLPGFIDAHHHLSLSAVDGRTPSLDLPAGARIADLLERVRGYAETLPPGAWLRMQGWNRGRLREGRPPTGMELDAVTADRPSLLISYSFHEGLLNSAGLEAMHWDRRPKDPRNGRIGRDRLGRPTGLVWEEAFFQAEARSRGSLLESAEDAWLAEVARHAKEVLAAGITRLGDAAVPPSLERLYRRAVEADLLPLTVHRMPVAAESVLRARVPQEPTGAGPARCPAGAAKLLIDGADNCAICLGKRQGARALASLLRAAAGGAGLAAIRTAIRFGGWRIRHDGLLHRGMLFYRQDELDATVRRAAEAGLQVAQHAIGNEAIERALGGIRAAGPALADLPGRPRLEHAVVLDPALNRAIADSGAIAVVQPRWVHALGDDFNIVSGAAPLRALGLRSMLDAGVEVAGSSDYPVAGFDVLEAVQAAVTRRTAQGLVLHPDEAITVEEALRAYTVTAARALGVESEAGSLAPGKLADLVVLSRDPLRHDPDRLSEIAVLRTYVGGRERYRLSK